jgi:hypothetical protein
MWRGGESAAASATTIQPPMVVRDDIQHTAEHAAGLNATESHTICCLPDYCNRIMDTIGFIRENYTVLIDSLIVQLTPEQGPTVSNITQLHMISCMTA